MAVFGISSDISPAPFLIRLYVIFIEFTATILLKLKAGFASNLGICAQIHFSANSWSGMDLRNQRRASLRQRDGE